MPDPQLLEQLRQLRASERHYVAFRREQPHGGDDSLARLLGALGHPVGDDDALRQDVAELDVRDWRRVLPPVAVIRPGRSTHVAFTVLRPLLEQVDWLVALEEGGERRGSIRLDELPVHGERHIGELCYCRLGFDLPGDLPLGYHTLTLYAGSGVELGHCRLIVVPHRCYEPDVISRGERLWGLAIQLYSLRSVRNWGIGDFTDLRELMPAAAARGVDIVGLNPLHALFPADAALHSPYSPASRDFLNVIYIDPEAIPEFARCREAVAMGRGVKFLADLAGLRATRLVEYAGVGRGWDTVRRRGRRTVWAGASGGGGGG